MLSFKQFDEMAILGTGLKPGSGIHNKEEQKSHRDKHNESIERGDSKKIGNVNGLHLYKETVLPKKKEYSKTSIYRLVHPKTGNVHMSLSAEEEKNELNIHKVGKHIAGETPKAEDFYLGIAHHDKGLKNINSDTILTPGGFNIWKRLTEKGKRLGHTFSHEGKEIDVKDIVPDGDFTSFSMKIKR